MGRSLFARFYTKSLYSGEMKLRGRASSLANIMPELVISLDSFVCPTFVTLFKNHHCFLACHFSQICRNFVSLRIRYQL